MVALLALGGTLVFLHQKHANPQLVEPIYSGRTLKQWLISNDFETNNAAVTLVILEMGEKSLPTLREMLHSGTKLDRAWFAKAPERLYQHLPIGGYQFERKDRAMWALEKLGRAARPATPELLAILQDKTEHFNQRTRALKTLCSIETDQTELLRVLQTLTNDPIIGFYATGHYRTLIQSRRYMAEQRKHAEILNTFTTVTSTVSTSLDPQFKPTSFFSQSNLLWSSEGNQRPFESIKGSQLSLTNEALLHL